MTEFITLLQSFGDQTLEYLWFPLVIWTIIALPITLLLHRLESIAPVYQYHSRVALIVILPMSMLGSYLADILSSSATSASGATFFVIQNPISISAGASENSMTLSIWEPTLWLGLLGMLLIAGALYFLAKLVVNYIRLKKLESKLDFRPLSQCSELVKNLSSVEKNYEKTQVAYSQDINIPFTYGWRNTRIVIPHDLKTNAETLSMAVQHELMHIKHRDFLLNSLLVFIKSIFWFHPLIHNLHNSAQEFREITCDGEVLANKQFSKKKYASLLFDLAKREHQSHLAMSMAVHPSSLKKRIQIMSSQNNLTTKFRSSFLITLTSAALIVLTISCTDMADDGITNSEVEQTQSQVASTDDDSLPLFIINGEEFTDKKKVTRIKSKYIKHIQVLKEEEATNEYGSKAKNGALKITLNNPEKALSDLKDEEMLVVQKTPPSSENNDFYHTVENMPELKGGLADLQQQIEYPQSAREAEEQGRVVVRFIVNEQGAVEDPEVVKGVSEALDQEALRVVKQAQFEPGKQDGKPVRVQYSLPITYQLDSNNEEG